jgi:hypothetical protein
MVWPTIDVQFMPGFLKNIRNEKYNMSYCYKLIPAIRHPVNHNFFVFPDRSNILGMWMHDHKAVCRVP